MWSLVTISKKSDKKKKKVTIDEGKQDGTRRIKILIVTSFYTA